jgi:hypothetical protein
LGADRSRAPKSEPQRCVVSCGELEPITKRRNPKPRLCKTQMATVNDLKARLAALLDTPEGKALIEEGRMFSAEELHAAFAQLLGATDGEVREVIKGAWMR